MQHHLVSLSFSFRQLDDGVCDGGVRGRHLFHHHQSGAVDRQHVTRRLRAAATATWEFTIHIKGFKFIPYVPINSVMAPVFTRPLRGCGVPVVKSAAQNGVFTGLQHDVAAHEPPHGSPAVSQQASQRQRPRTVVGRPKDQDAQVQQVTLCRVPPPENTGGEKSFIPESGSGLDGGFPDPLCGFKTKD